MIVGITIVGIVVIVGVVVVVICCLHMKKRGQVGQVVRPPDQGSYPQNNTVVYASKRNIYVLDRPCIYSFN